MRNEDTTTGEPRGTAAKVKEKVGDATEQVKETASHVAAGARDRGEHLIEEGREKAHELTDRAGELARSRADRERRRVADGIRTFADALRRGSSELSGERDQFRPLLTSAADRAERLSNLLESRDVDALTSDVKRFAREHPTLFVSGAFALGFLGARFLRSSEEQAIESRYGDADRFTGYPHEDRFDRALPETGTYEAGSRGTGGGYE